MEEIILIANPGSASRKYALYSGDKLLLSLHFEIEDGQVVFNFKTDNGQSTASHKAGISHLAFAANKVYGLAGQLGILSDKKQIKAIGLRVVAPSTYFQADRLLNASTLDKLKDLEVLAPLHVNASLQEAHLLKQDFPTEKIVAVSDSAFHVNLPDVARYYGISTRDSEKLDIYRFGYHGLSVESVVGQLKEADKLPHRLIVCHLGSGSSVTAVKNGKSIDCSMGFSPLEGLVMATRSGDIDTTAAEVIAKEKGLGRQQLQDYLNNQSGLLGISGKSSDIRELLKLEGQGDNKAALALDIYVYKIQQAIGKMAAGLGGIDGLVFTGTVGERSAAIRRRVIEKLLFLGLGLDPHLNHVHLQPAKLTKISASSHPVKIYIVPASEDTVMLQHVRNAL